MKVSEDFKRTWQQQALEMDPNINFQDPCYAWGTPEKNEACVRRIEEKYQGRTGEIVFYGPSNITFWYSLEKDMLPYCAQNHGMGGCTDEDLIAYAPRLLYPFKPQVVFFQTGSNDLAHGLTLPQIMENKKRMYGEFLENMPETKLVVMSGLPLPGRQQFWEATKETNAFLQAFCQEHDRMYFMDSMDTMLSDTGDEENRTADGRYFRPEYFMIDRVHLNAKGHAAWMALMKKQLEAIL